MGKKEKGTKNHSLTKDMQHNSTENHKRKKTRNEQTTGEWGRTPSRIQKRDRVNKQITDPRQAEVFVKEGWWACNGRPLVGGSINNETKIEKRGQDRRESIRRMLLSNYTMNYQYYVIRSIF